MWTDSGGIYMVGNNGGAHVTEDEGLVRVTTISLNDVLAELGDVHLLKVDIEGAEFDALAAVEGHLPQQCFLFVEIHQGDADLERINRWAQENGFRYVMGRRAEDFIDGSLTRA